MRHDALTLMIAAVWLGNGLCCKVLDLVPRHRAIVARILSERHSRLITIAIGAAEIAMMLWVLSGVEVRVNAITQIVVVASMNVLEFFIARDLLLFGPVNAIIAALFIAVVTYWGFFY